MSGLGHPALHRMTNGLAILPIDRAPSTRYENETSEVIDLSQVGARSKEVRNRFLMKTASRGCSERLNQLTINTWYGMSGCPGLNGLNPPRTASGRCQNSSMLDARPSWLIWEPPFAPSSSRTVPSDRLRLWASASESDGGTRRSFPATDPGRELFQLNAAGDLCHGRASFPARRLRGPRPVDRLVFTCLLHFIPASRRLGPTPACSAAEALVHRACQ